MDDNYSAVLAEVDAELASDAMAVAAGVYSSVTLRDRFRACIGGTVRITAQGLDQALTATTADVVDDAVLVVAPAAHWVIWFTAIEEVRGLSPGHVSQVSRGRSGRSAARLLRPFAGHPVRVGRRDGQVAGMLRRVGADHLEVGSEAAVVPFSAARFVSGQLLGLASSSAM